MPQRDADLAQRLRPFQDAGLIPRLPTSWQIRQGTLEMTPYVISTDVTAEEGYQRGPWGHPWLRQPLIFSQIGLDHLRTGSALGARLESLCAHLHLTHHRGMPVFDLQVIQTHPHGLDRLQRSIEDLLARAPSSRRRRGIAAMILAEPDRYFEQFLGESGWIARAARFDYPTPADEGSNFPPEYFSLVAFLNYCAATFPARVGDVTWSRYPAHLARLVGRRFREGHRMGWFERDRQGSGA